MRRGTTPTVRLHIKESALEGYKVLMTLRQDRDDVGPYPVQEELGRQKIIFPIIVNKSGEDVTVTAQGDGTCFISAKLTQADTLKFCTGLVKVQVRWIDEFKNVGGSEVVTTEIEPILANGELVIEDETAKLAEEGEKPKEDTDATEEEQQPS